MFMEVDLLFWGILTVAFIVVEMATTALVSIWFVFGSLVAFGCAIAGFDFLPQCYVFTGVSIVVFAMTRSFVKKVKPVKEATNSDRLIGMNGVVITRIDNLHDEGRVLVHGLDWRARASNNEIIEPKTVIVVDRIEGVTVWVSVHKD